MSTVFLYLFIHLCNVSACMCVDVLACCDFRNTELTFTFLTPALFPDVFDRIYDSSHFFVERKQPIPSPHFTDARAVKEQHHKTTSRKRQPALSGSAQVSLAPATIWEVRLGPA